MDSKTSDVKEEITDDGSNENDRIMRNGENNEKDEVSNNDSDDSDVGNDKLKEKKVSNDEDDADSLSDYSDISSLGFGTKAKISTAEGGKFKAYIVYDIYILVCAKVFKFVVSRIFK